MHLRSGLKRRRVVLAAAGAGVLAAAGLRRAHADVAWPTKPVTLIVPFVAGGTIDILARIAGEKLADALEQPVVIDNRPGGGGTHGAALAAHANADGYTLVMTTVAHAIAPALSRSLSYDLVHDLDAVALVGTAPDVLVVAPSVPATNVQELIAYIRSHPGEVNYGSAGPGSAEHLCCEWFRSLTGTQITHIPYKLVASRMADLMSGQIQMAIEAAPSVAQYVHPGRVRALAVTGAHRSPAFPGIPTLAEAGVPGYDATTWFALMAPHGTPSLVLQRLHAELAQVLRQDDVVRKFAEQYVVPGDLGPGAAAALIRHESDKWRKLAKDAGLVPE